MMKIYLFWVVLNLVMGLPEHPMVGADPHFLQSIPFEGCSEQVKVRALLLTTPFIPEESSQYFRSDTRQQRWRIEGRGKRVV
jgi:hypothetical protein